MSRADARLQHDEEEEPRDTAGDDARFLAEVLGDERDARARFVERYGSLVYAVITRTLRRCGGGSQDRATWIEDVFAEVFVALFDRDARRLRQWSGRCSLATWVRLISASVSVDRLRRDASDRAHAAREAIPDALPSEGAAALDLIVRAEELAAVRRALGHLSPSDRALIELLYVDELGPGAAAERLGIAPGALYTRKNRALERLRAALAKERGDKGDGPL